MGRFLRNRDLQYLFIILLPGVATVALYHKYFYTGLIVSDTAVYAEAARNLVEGKGLVLSKVVPGFLPYLREMRLPTPYLFYPLLPVLTAGVFWLVGPHEWAVAVVPTAAFLGSAVLVYMLGRTIYGRRVGVLSALTLLLEPKLLGYSLRGATEPLLMLLLLLTVWVLITAAQKDSSALYSLGGLLCGLTLYAKATGLFFLLPALFLIYLYDRRNVVRRAGWVLLFFALAMVPMWYRNWTITGSPFFNPGFMLLQTTKSFPGQDAVYAILPPSTWLLVKTYYSELASKWIFWMGAAVVGFFKLAHPLILSGYLLAFLQPPEQQPALRFQWFSLVLFVVVTAYTALVFWNVRYLSPVVPIIILVFWGFVFSMGDRGSFSKPWPIKTIACVALMGIVAGPFLETIYRGRMEHPRLVAKRDSFLEFARFLKEHVEPGEIVMTTRPGFVAWSNRNITVLIPPRIEYYNRLRKYLSVDSIVLTSDRIENPFFARSDEWREAFAGKRGIFGFRQSAVFDNEFLRAVILRPSPTKQGRSNPVPFSQGSDS